VNVDALLVVHPKGELGQATDLDEVIESWIAAEV